MVKDLVLHQEKRRSIQLEPIFEVYEMVCAFQDNIVPSLTNIYIHYTSMLEGRIANLHASIYSDDFYDGSPGSVPSRTFPDSVRDRIPELIEMDDKLTLEELEEILERFCLFYIHKGRIRHQAQVEVW